MGKHRSMLGDRLMSVARASVFADCRSLKLGSYPSKRDREERALSLQVTVSKDGSQLLEKDSPG